MSEIEKIRDERIQRLAELLIEAIGQRQLNGEMTTLRDLHRILDVSQPLALRAAARLEKQGIATITRNLADAFASEIKVPAPQDGTFVKATRPWRSVEK